MSDMQKIFQLSVPSPHSSNQSCAVCEPMLKPYSEFIKDKAPEVAKKIEAFIASCESGTPEYNDVVVGELRPSKEGEEYEVCEYVYQEDAKVKYVFKDVKVKLYMVQELHKGYMVIYAQILSIGNLAKFKKKKVLDISQASSNVIDVIKKGNEIGLKPLLAYKVSEYRFTSDAKEDMEKKEAPESVLKQMISDLGISSWQ